MQTLFLAVTLLTTPIVKSESTEALVSQLKAGNARFVAGHSNHANQDVLRREEVAQGQKPFAIVLTCADSRLSPEIVFDQGLGDLFVVRVAGNVVDDFSLASIEYAAEHLGSSLLVVMGHERCGAVKAALDTFKSHAKIEEGKDHKEQGHGKQDKHGEAHEGHIPALVSEILPSVKAVVGQPGSDLDNAIKHNVIRTVGRIQSSEPLKSMIKTGQLTVMGAVYDLDSGVVRLVSQSSPTEGSSFVKVHKG